MEHLSLLYLIQQLKEFLDRLKYESQVKRVEGGREVLVLNCVGKVS